MRNVWAISNGLVGLAVLVFIAQGCADPTAGKPEAVVNEPASEAQAPIEEPMEKMESEPAAEPMPDEAADEAATLTILPASSIGFVGSKVTGSHDGGFNAFSGTVTVPGGDLTKATVNVTIDINSMYTDNDNLTQHLLSADFFDAEKFPEATLKTTAITPEGDGYTVTGDLTLHGVTKNISFPAALSLVDGKLTGHAEFSINRFDFGIEYPGKPDDLIRPDVLIKLHVEAA